MTTLSVAVFILVYIGMALGRIPGLAVGRTGVALLGLIVLLASGDLTLDEAGRAIDAPTIALLFALMIVSAPLARASATRPTELLSGICAGPSGSPGATSSSPVESTASRGRRYTESVP